MFLVADTTQLNPPTYLVSGDLAVLLTDAVSAGNLRSAGIPLVQMSPQEITSISQALAPPS
jgi:hypothetical protein